MDISIRELGREDINCILPLASELNPDIPDHILRERLEEMFSLSYKFWCLPGWQAHRDMWRVDYDEVIQRKADRIGQPDNRS